MREANQIKIGALLTYVIIGIQAILGIAYVPFLTHSLGQGEFGLYSLVSSIISYMSLLDFGFGQAIIVYSSKNLHKRNKDEEFSLYGTFFLIYCFISILTILAGIFVYNNIYFIFGQNMAIEEIEKLRTLLLILSINITFTFIFSIFGNIISTYEKFIFNKCIQILKLLLQPLIVVPLMLCGSDSIGLVVVITIVNIVCLLVNAYYCFYILKIKLKFKRINNYYLNEIIGFSVLVFLSDLVDKVNMFADNIILGMFSGATVVAVYAVAIQFVQIYRSFSFAISGVLLPMSSKMEGKKANEINFSNLFIKAGRIQFIILSLVFSGFLLFGKQVIIILFGEEYYSSYIIASILMFALIIPQSQTVGINIILAKNKNLFRASLYVILAIINIIISCYIAPIYGAVGTSSVTAGSYLLGNVIIINFYYSKVIKLNIKLYWKEIVKLSLPIISMLIPSLIIVNLIGESGITILIIEIFVFIILYLIVAWRFMLKKSEKTLILKDWTNNSWSIYSLLGF